MTSFQVTYHAKDGNKICELGGFRFADGEMVDVTDNEANRATLEEIKKNPAFTTKEVKPPPVVEPVEAKSDKAKMAHPKDEPKKNQHEQA
jgi:hypothetical protein